MTGRGDDRHLGRTAGEAADKGVGQVDEELRDARALQKGAEDDEDDDELRADLHRRAENAAALHLVEQADRDVAHRARGAQALRGGVVEQRVHDENARHAEDRDAHAAAAELKRRENADDGDHDLIGPQLRHAQTHGQVLGVRDDVEEGARAREHQDPVVPRDVVDLLRALSDGEDEIADQQHAAHEGGIADQIEPGGEERDVDHEQRKGRHDPVHDPFRPALPDAGVGFAVIFLHDLVHRGLVEGLGFGGDFSFSDLFGHKGWLLQSVINGEGSAALFSRAALRCMYGCAAALRARSLR